MSRCSHDMWCPLCMAIEIEGLRAVNADLLMALTNLLDFHNEGRIPTRDALARAETAVDKATGAAS